MKFELEKVLNENEKKEEKSDQVHNCRQEKGRKKVFFTDVDENHFVDSIISTSTAYRQYNNKIEE